MPTLEELSYKPQGAKYFSKLDAKCSYWSVHLDEKSQLLTTFRTPIEQFCFMRLPFGLATSQDIFQARMDTILEQCNGAMVQLELLMTLLYTVEHRKSTTSTYTTGIKAAEL